ncbi:hypothetical protein FA95DRAFT_1552023 [Auriscalpium vulgare]|uniref:Uncharacterized protein n=1 Tax=Auriscalpium vulgare TaxID=40419 RepID=A0ACB8SC41_9AGAM|nr:hypothetical protein FA95DRAFT_1552023 [Auriscalpium vulgare]
MSHLTASPFHKPSPAEVYRPSQLPTPPETDTDFPGPSQIHTQSGPAFPFVHAPLEPETTPFTPVPLARRTSTLSYHNTPLRDIRDRNPRQTRWLVVVIPPPSLSKTHGNLGHTLGSGPASRVSQGILMPLLPTMYGQLTAIAREFNFPSTVGLCLYLQVNEQGITMTPRISDEIWSVLWGHLFEARSPTPSPLQLPICGRVEFDIDLNKARWYEAWLMSDRRAADGIPSGPPSMSHWRGDSKTSIHDEPLGDDRSDIMQAPANRSRPALHRHVPRKLSLLDKLDTASVGSGLVNVVNALEEPSAIVPLPPIEQEDEPKTAKNDLEIRVKSWRASSSVAPTPMAATGQTSLDPVHMPNTMALPEIAAAPETSEEVEFNLDDFTWSVSSLGPGDYDSVASPLPSSRVESVHLDRRLEGSVLLSPTTATSWGPGSDGYESLDEPLWWARAPSLHSVHLDRRMEGSVLLSPSTATSWGPDDDAVSIASSISRLPSPDIAFRHVEDAPPTPTTATSWGAPSSYPPSPVSVTRPPSIHLAHRMAFSPGPSPSSEVFGWVYPFVDARHASNESGHVFPYFTPAAQVSQFVYPRFRPDSAAPSSLVYPQFRPDMSAPSSLVWPFFVPAEQLASVTLVRARAPVPSQGYPFFDLYPAVASAAAQGLTRAYPMLNIYPVAYPHFEMYPGHVCVAWHHEESQSVHLPAVYPAINLYPAVYPDFEIYPGNLIAAERHEEPRSVRLPALYPRISLYPVQYPDFEIYPGHAVMVKDWHTPVSVHLKSAYPDLEIYRSVYPFLVIYPSVSDESRTQAQDGNLLLDIYSAGKVFDDSDYYLSKAVRLAAVYPAFDIYPSVYPALDIYPFIDLYTAAVAPGHGRGSSRSVYTHAEVYYPVFNIYPAVYPAFNLYPGITPQLVEDQCVALSTRLQPAYPSFCLFPAVYPFFEIYPGEVCNGEVQGAWRTYPSILAPKYPFIDIYPAVYPYFDIYRSGTSTKQENQQEILSVRLPALYPAFDLYPPVYPHFELWPSTSVGFVSPPQSTRTHPPHKDHDIHNIVHSDRIVEAETKPTPSIRRPSIHIDSLPQPAPIVRTRSRSGTVNARPPSVHSSARSPSVYVAEGPPVASPIRRMGLPSHPRDAAPPRPVSSFIPTLSPSKERSHSAALQRSNTQPSRRPVGRVRDSSVSPEDERPPRSGSHSGHKPAIRPRDSIVLEKAKLFDASGSPEVPTRITMSTLAEFPLPPIPPVPSMQSSRPIAKLDKAKYPFA